MKEPPVVSSREWVFIAPSRPRVADGDVRIDHMFVVLRFGVP
jgi:hypothetical protein